MNYSDGDIVVSHEKVRISNRSKEPQRRLGKTLGCSEWFVLGNEVLDEFKHFVLQNSR